MRKSRAFSRKLTTNMLFYSKKGNSTEIIAITNKNSTNIIEYNRAAKIIFF
jgi:hypothetical protein